MDNPKIVQCKLVPWNKPKVAACDGGKNARKCKSIYRLHIHTYRANLKLIKTLDKYLALCG
jgi:hypothetical protein